MSQLQIAVSCVQRMEVIVKMKKKREKVREKGGCVQRMEVIVERKKNWGGGGGGGGRGGEEEEGEVDQGRFEWRSEAFVKIQ